MEQKKIMQCEICRQEIQLAEDLLTVEKGVNGPRGVVPLGKVLIFCSEEHVSKYFDNSETDLDNRVPY